MHLIRVGRRRLNLEYLIVDEENDGTEATSHIPPGGVRVVMETGIAFDLVGDDADAYKRQVNEAVLPDPGAKKAGRLPVVGHAVTRKGPSKPRVPEQRERRG